VVRQRGATAAARDETTKEKRDDEPGQTWSALQAQGRVWRAMLSGEKLPTDLLTKGDYIDAAEALGSRFRTLGKHVVKQHRVALIVLGLLTAALVAAALERSAQ
jgi:hypothetical protein